MRINKLIAIVALGLLVFGVGQAKASTMFDSLIAEHWVLIPFQGLVRFSARTLAAERFCSRAAPALHPRLALLR